MKICLDMEKVESLIRLLHEFRGCAPTTILTIVFCRVNTVLLYDQLPGKKNDFIFHYGVKIGKINYFESVKCCWCQT